MAKVRLVFSYHGYPMRKADEVVRDNITGDDDWQENLLYYLNEYGLDASAAEIGEPFPADADEDFVAVRLPVTVTHSGNPKFVLGKYCEDAVDFHTGFYCDSCYWEDA